MSASKMLAVAGFIHLHERLLSNNPLNAIPNSVVELCFHFYFIPQQLFIRYYSRTNGTQIGIINMRNRYISKLLFQSKLSSDQRIADRSPYFIPNISNLLYNLSSDITKSLHIDFKSKSYDALFCIVNEHSALLSKPCFILYESKYMMYTYTDIRTIIPVLLISKRPLSFKIKSIIHFSEQHGIFCKSADDDFYQLRLENIKSDNFEFNKCNYNKYSNYYYGDLSNINQKEQFVEQEKVSYKEALNAFLKNQCCAGLYDFNTEQWRTAVYLKHSDSQKTISVVYVDLDLTPCVLKDFPLRTLQIHNKRFHVDQETLRQISRVRQNRMYVSNLSDYQILFSEKFTGLEFLMDWNGRFRFVQYCISQYCDCSVCYDNDNDVIYMLTYYGSLLKFDCTKDTIIRYKVDNKPKRNYQSILWIDQYKSYILYCAFIPKNECWYGLSVKCDEKKNGIKIYHLDIRNKVKQWCQFGDSIDPKSGDLYAMDTMIGLFG